MSTRLTCLSHITGTLAWCLMLAWHVPAWADILHDFDLPAPPRNPEPRSNTVEQVLNRIAPTIVPGLEARFEAAGVPYPPAALTLIGLKAELRLEVWAYHRNQPYYIDSYPIYDASGLPGPKRRRGDYQVPEGIYRIDAFNPNSNFHLSMRLDYPNSFDRQMGYRDQRDDLGSNIFIHGDAVSQGCLAMGDPGIEELFVLVADTGMRNTRVIIAPHDPRVRTIFPIPRGLPDWTNALYEELETAIAGYTWPRPDRALLPGVDLTQQH